MACSRWVLTFMVGFLLSAMAAAFATPSCPPTGTSERRLMLPDGTGAELDIPCELSVNGEGRWFKAVVTCQGDRIWTWDGHDAS